MVELVQVPWVFTFSTALVGLLLWFTIKRAFLKVNGPNYPPAVPGLPIIGNLLQLKGVTPHKVFTNWASMYGPIYRLKTGSSNIVVISSSQLAKEVTVSKFSSISTRKMTTAFNFLTAGQKIVAISDYGEEHKLMKKYYISAILGSNAQKRFRCHRETVIQNLMKQLYSELRTNPAATVTIRETLKSELLGLGLKQTVGRDFEWIDVEELGGKVTKREIYDIVVVGILLGAGLTDWRNHFPWLKWVPNPRLIHTIHQLNTRRNAVVNALITHEMRRIESGKGGPVHKAPANAGSRKDRCMQHYPCFLQSGYF